MIDQEAKFELGNVMVMVQNNTDVDEQPEQVDSEEKETEERAD